MNSRCPTCGHPLTGDRDPRPIIEALRDNTVRFAMLEALASRFGEWVSREDLEDLTYGPRHDGGPLAAKKTFHVYAYENRKRLRPYGLTIEGMRAGQQPGSFRLKWAVPSADGRDWLLLPPPTPSGRSLGGHARAAKLSPEQRSAIARKAAIARHHPEAAE